MGRGVLAPWVGARLFCRPHAPTASWVETTGFRASDQHQLAAHPCQAPSRPQAGPRQVGEAAVAAAWEDAAWCTGRKLGGELG